LSERGQKDSNALQLYRQSQEKDAFLQQIRQIERKRKRNLSSLNKTFTTTTLYFMMRVKENFFIEEFVIFDQMHLQKMNLLNIFPCVNFFNILRTHFSYKSLFGSFSLHVSRKKLRKALS